MKRTRFNEHQIITILKEAESGVKVADLCRRHGGWLGLKFIPDERAPER